MADPWEQFPSTPPSSGGGDDPWGKFPTSPGGAAKTATPSYSPDPISSTALSFLDAAGGGLATLGLPDQVKQDVAAAHRNLGWADYPVSAAGYGLGIGKVLGPAGKMIGGAGIGGMAAEGALAGGLYDTAQGGNPLTGAITGGALGGGAGLIGKGIGKALTKPGAVDPAAAIDSLGKTKTDAYAALRKVPVDPDRVDSVIGGVMRNLDPSVETGMSPGLKSQINDIRSTLQDQSSANADQVDSWQRQINDAAQRNRYPTDSIVAGQIDTGLDGLLKQNGAGDLQDAAQAAHKNYAMAQSLSEWQAKVKAGGNVGEAPRNQAEDFYQDDPDKYKTLIDLYQQGHGGVDPSYSAAHLGSSLGGAAGAAVGGWPGSLVGHQVGYYGGKLLGKTVGKGVKTNALLKAYQAAYPSLTGVQPTGGSQGPQVGDMIKNLMIGGAY